MKLLLLLTQTFPCDTGEEFLSAELNEAAGFDKILICPCGVKESSVQTRAIPQNAECVPVPRVKLGRFAYLRLLFYPCVLAEILNLIRTGRFQPARVHQLFFFMKNAVEIYGGLKQLKAVREADSAVVYSYWLYDAAAAGALFSAYLRKKNIRVRQISRAHGFDIHPERSEYGYLPMRSFLFRRLDRIFPCSEDGGKVLRGQAGADAVKIRTSYLGTRDCGTGQAGRTPFHLVSCSYMVPVKRLHLIAEALEQADFPVLWTHLGSGPLEEEIRSKTEKLPKNVRAEFLGQMKNEDILDYYKKNSVSVFINVSSSEGIPVSVMEACSFGLPVIATDVGGTGEIVSDGVNGYLLSKDFSPQMLLERLRSLLALDNGEYAEMCAGSRRIWEEKFNAAQNYRRFYEEISR